MEDLTFKEKMEKLHELIINSNELNDILQYENDLNIFKILKIEKTEIRHSNMLAWLLNSAENHGLNTLFAKIWFGQIIKDNYNDIKNFSIETLMLHSLDDFLVYREKFNIDILLISEKHNQLIVIENKIDSKEHDKQLKKYEEKINQEFINFEKLFIYLAPDLNEDIRNDRWLRVRYDTIENSLSELISNVKNETVKLIIKNYIEILRREIMEEDTKLKELSLDIYKKYQKALDIIYEYKPDLQQNIKDIIDEVLINVEQKKDIGLIRLPSAKGYIRFTTNILRKKSDEQGNEKWIKGMKDILIFEIINAQNYDLYIKFMAGPSDNKLLRNSFLELANKNDNILKNISKGTDWTQLWKKTLLQKNKIQDNASDIDAIKEEIQNNLMKIIKEEIPHIEQIFV